MEKRDAERIALECCELRIERRNVAAAIVRLTTQLDRLGQAVAQAQESDEEDDVVDDDSFQTPAQLIDVAADIVSSLVDHVVDIVNDLKLHRDALRTIDAKCAALQRRLDPAA